MSNQVNFSAMNPSQRFAHFVGEVTGIAGKIIGSLEKYTIGRIEEAATGNETLKTLVDGVKASGDTIAQAFFAIGCIYNFYTSPALFFAGTGLGALTSAAPFPVKFMTLQQGELLGRTAKDDYAASKVMFSLAALNFYLGRTLLDDMSISIFSGLLAGNSFYHILKESSVGKGVSMVSEQLKAMTDLVLPRLPFYR